MGSFRSACMGQIRRFRDSPPLSLVKPFSILNSNLFFMKKEESASYSESTLGTQVRQLRQAAGLTQVQLAQKLGTSQKAIVRLEKGQGTPTVSTLQRVAEALNVRLFISMNSKPETTSPVNLPFSEKQLFEIKQALIEEIFSIFKEYNHPLSKEDVKKELSEQENKVPHLY